MGLPAAVSLARQRYRDGIADYVSK